MPDKSDYLNAIYDYFYFIKSFCENEDDNVFKLLATFLLSFSSNTPSRFIFLFKSIFVIFL